MSIEPFGGSNRSKKASRREIQQIKKNMKKVPHIQKKSQEFHARESEQAEQLFEQSVQELNNPDHKPSKKQDQGPTKTWRNKLFERLIHKIA